MRRLRRRFGQFIHSRFDLGVGAREPAVMLSQACSSQDGTVYSSTKRLGNEPSR